MYIVFTLYIFDGFQFRGSTHRTPYTHVTICPCTHRPGMPIWPPSHTCVYPPYACYAHVSNFSWPATIPTCPHFVHHLDPMPATSLGFSLAYAPFALISSSTFSQNSFLFHWSHVSFGSNILTCGLFSWIFWFLLFRQERWGTAEWQSLPHVPLDFGI